MGTRNLISSSIEDSKRGVEGMKGRCNIDEILSRGDKDEMQQVLQQLEGDIKLDAAYKLRDKLDQLEDIGLPDSSTVTNDRQLRERAIYKILDTSKVENSEGWSFGGGGGVSLPGVRIDVGVSASHESFEKIVGVNNLTNIAWLNKGLQLARAVCRIKTPSGFGTGFLIGSNTLITNNHVLPDSQVAAESEAEFNYEQDWDGNTLPVRRFKILKTSFRTNPKLDYSIAQTEGRPGAC